MLRHLLNIHEPPSAAWKQVPTQELGSL